MGLKIAYVAEVNEDGSVPYNAHYSDGTIYVNTKSKEVNASIIIHEYVHHLKKTSSAKWEATTAILDKHIAENEVAKKIFDDAYTQYSENARTKEQGAEVWTEEAYVAVLESMTDEKTLDRMLSAGVKTYPTTWQRIKSFFTSLLNRLKGQGMTEAAEEVRTARDRINDALEKYAAESAETAQNEVKDGEKRFCLVIEENNELAQLIADNPDKSIHNVVSEYLVGNFKGQTFNLSDGKTAIMDGGDSDKLAHNINKKKIAELAQIKKIIETAKFVGSTAVSHKKFSHFNYYEIDISFNGKEFTALINVGKAKNDGTYHIYEIINDKSAAHRFNDVSGSVDNRIQNNTFSNPSIRNSSEKSTPNAKKDDGERYSLGNGYDGYSMSNNARDAYDSGEMPLSKWTRTDIIEQIEELNPTVAQLAKGLNAAELKDTFLYRSSWHHTSEYYNKTYFYSIDENAVESFNEEQLNSIIERRKRVEKQSKPVSAPKTITAVVEYTVWGGSRNHPTHKDYRETVHYKEGDKMVSTEHGGNKRISSLRFISKTIEEERFSLPKEPTNGAWGRGLYFAEEPSIKANDKQYIRFETEYQYEKLASVLSTLEKKLKDGTLDRSYARNLYYALINQKNGMYTPLEVIQDAIDDILIHNTQEVKGAFVQGIGYNGIDARGIEGFMSVVYDAEMVSDRAHEEKAQRHLERAKKIFGTTESYDDAGWLMPDGEMLNFKRRDSGTALEHRDIERAFERTRQFNAQAAFMEEGNIRLSPNMPALELSVMPTDAQLEQIEKFVEHFASQPFFVEIRQEGDKSIVPVMDYPAYVNPSDVTRDIVNHFKYGTVRSDISTYRYSIANVNGKDTVIIDTDQSLFDGLKKSEFADIARLYMTETYRGKVINGVEFTSRSEREYTHSEYTEAIKNAKSTDAIFNGKMRAVTELDNLVKTGRYLRHETAKHQKPFNQNGYDRYDVSFVLDGVGFDGEMLVALGDSKAIFYDIVSIKENGVALQDISPAGVNVASYISIRQDFGKSTLSAKKPTDRLSLPKDKEYLDAVKSGDTATAQKLVDEAAKKAGYAIKAYHGTTAKKFNVFAPNSFFSPDKNFAEQYTKVLQTDGSNEPRVYEVYLKSGVTKKVSASTVSFEARGILDKAKRNMLLVKAPASQNGIEEYIVKNPNQIKSADAITYDDNGEVIPLSERFNEKNDDIRYSLVKYTEQEKQNWANSQRVFVAESESDIVSFIEEAKEGKRKGQKLLLGKLSTENAQIIFAEVGVELTNYNLELRADYIQHIVNGHFDNTLENLRGQRAVTVEDIKNYIDVVTDFDSVRKGDTEKSLIFTKRINGKVIAVTQYAFSNKSLYLTTMYVQKGKKKNTLAQTLDAHSHTPKQTSETELSTGVIPNTSVRQNTEKSTLSAKKPTSRFSLPQNNGSSNTDIDSDFAIVTRSARPNTLTPAELQKKLANHARDLVFSRKQADEFVRSIEQMQLDEYGDLYGVIKYKQDYTTTLWEQANKLSGKSQQAKENYADKLLNA